MTSLPVENTSNNSPDADQADKFDHTEIKGRFNQYTSGYWALALPALAARYIGRYIGQLFEFDSIEKYPGLKRFYPIAVGGWMAYITGLYASRTYADMKRVFSETLAYEFDKKPEDVGIRDFFNSKNAIVHTTLWNSLKYNSRRAAVASSFFAFLLPWKFRTTKADSVDLGVGVAGAYLVTDVLSRKVTFFEALQSFIDNKINHVESVGHVIADTDLMNLYAIHARDNPPDHLVSGKMDTVGWHNDKIIFSRMADLMNQTYGNTPNKEQAKFTVPMLIYLLGNNLITRENKAHSLAYIEIANRYGIPEVKKAADVIKNGVPLEQVIVRYAIQLPPISGAGEIIAAQSIPAAPEKKFTDAISSRAAERPPIVPSSLAEQVTAKRQLDSEAQLTQSA